MRFHIKLSLGVGCCRRRRRRRRRLLTLPPVFPLDSCLLLQVLIKLYYIYFIHRRLVCAHITHYERIWSKKRTSVTIHTSAAVPAGVCIVFPFVFVRVFFLFSVLRYLVPMCCAHSTRKTNKVMFYSHCTTSI